MDDNKSLKELTKEITSICISDYLHRGNKICNIDQYVTIYLNEYKIIYKNLTKDEIFTKKINELAKEIALLYLEAYLLSYPRSTEESINAFIYVYKKALAKIEKEETSNKSSVLPEYKPNMAIAEKETETETTILPKYVPKRENISGLTFTNTKSPMWVRSKEVEEQLKKGRVKFRGMDKSFGR